MIKSSVLQHTALHRHRTRQLAHVRFCVFSPLLFDFLEICCAAFGASTSLLSVEEPKKEDFTSSLKLILTSLHLQAIRRRVRRTTKCRRTTTGRVTRQLAHVSDALI